MVVRLALLGARVDVGENAEAELRVLVQDLALRHAVAEMPGDECLVLQDLLDERAHLLATPGPGFRREDAVTGGRELFERVPHRGLLSRRVVSARPERRRP